MSTLSQADKDYIVAKSMKTITDVCSLHKIDMGTLPRPFLLLLIDIFQAGAGTAMEAYKEELKKFK